MYRPVVVKTKWSYLCA